MQLDESKEIDSVQNSSYIRKVTENIRKLSQMTLKYLEFPAAFIDYGMIADDLIELTGAEYVIVNTYDTANKTVVTRAFSGASEAIQTVSEILGCSPAGKVWQPDAAAISRMKSMKLTRLNGFQDLIFKLLSSKIVEMPENLPAVGEVFEIGISHKEEILGNIILIISENLKPDMADIVELYANQLGILLLRKNAEERLMESEECYRRLIEAERRKAEKKVPEKEKHLCQITENMLDIIYHTDNDLIIEYVSPSCRSVLGYSPEEMVGKSIFDFLHAEDLENVKNLARQSMKTGTAGISEFRYKHAKGYYTWLESVGNILFDSHGKVSGATFCSRDITMRKLVEEKLQWSEQRYRKLIELLPIAIFIHNEDGIIFYNRAATDLIGAADSKELLGRTFLDFIPLERHKPVLQRFADAIIEKGVSYFDDGQLIRNDGFVVDVDVITTSFLYEDKPAVLQVIRDITEHKRMDELEKTVEESNRLLTETMEYDKLRAGFFANISHELRTPLNVIFSTLQLLELFAKNKTFANNNAKNDKEEKYFKIMKQNCFRLLRLVNNLIDITKIDSNFFDLHLQNHNIVSIVEDITRSVAEYMQDKGVFLRFDTDVEVRIIACDPDKIERILLNLLSNAVKFTKSGGNIWVTVFDGEEHITIQVRDTGIGIPQDKLELIFQRFRQVDQSLTREFEGSGIGLSIVKSLVEMHGGRVRVNSEYGKGSEFIIELPIRILPENEYAQEKKDGSERNQIERINIEFSDIYSLY